VSDALSPVKVPHGRPSISTFSGREFYPLSPRVEDIDPVDIAHALAQKCRYTGHTLRFYSVAEHCVHVSDFLVGAGHGEALAFWGLLHDAAEAYLPDVAAPIKHLLTGFRDIEGRVLRVIADRFGLPWPEPAFVKEIDAEMVPLEKAYIMQPAEWWTVREPRLDLRKMIRPECWGPERAELEWLRRFVRLQGAGRG